MKITGMNELFYTKRVLEFADQNLKAESAQVRESFSAHTSTTLWGLWPVSYTHLTLPTKRIV